MQNVTEFRDYYEAELRALRQDAVAFGADFPAAAQALALGRGRSRDPQVELLLESFAWLAARLRHQLDRDAVLLPKTLMMQLYPHLTSSVPSLLIAHLGARPDAAYEKEVVLPRGRELRARGRDEDGRDCQVRLTSCFDAPIVPLEITEVRQSPASHYDGRDFRSVLRIRLRSTVNEPISALALGRLRFYIDIERPSAARLYELLALHLVGVGTADPGGPLRRCAGASLRFLGFEDDEAALTSELTTHPGYRLVQEYFAFPEKFFFFEVDGLAWGAAGDEADLLLLLDRGVETRVFGPAENQTVDWGKDALRLNCAPLINRFVERLEPFVLDHTQHEYRLTADAAHPQHSEINAVRSITAVRPGEPERPLRRFFALDDDFGRETGQDHLYVTRRVESTLASVPGTETWVSFLDLHMNVKQPANETIGGRALCTNRRLAEQLRIGDPLQLEGPGPIQDPTVASKPTPHQPPVLLGGQPWALVSQLLVNHLSLAEGELALGALRSMLRLHLGRASLWGARQIECLVDLRVERRVFPMTQEGRRTLVEGLRVTLVMDRQRNPGSGSLLLFAEVLRRFFALYAAINTVVELNLEYLDVKGIVKTWTPLSGTQIVL